MPTGYTAGILDGTINTFPEFVKTCMSAFGATIHMRDDSLNEEYQLRKPSNYHIKELKKAKRDLKLAINLPDDKIIQQKINQINNDIKWRTESKLKGQKNAIKLNEILDQAKKWNPPTEEHRELKKFMIQQIESTIDFDCRLSWIDKDLSKLNNQLTSVDANKARIEMIEKAKKDIAYHTEEYNKEIQRCDDSNKWVADLLNSLE